MDIDVKKLMERLKKGEDEDSTGGDEVGIDKEAVNDLG